MATLPERKHCLICGNLTRFTLDNGDARCRDCVEAPEPTYTYPVRMLNLCAFGQCFDAVISNDFYYCAYHMVDSNR